MVVGDKEQMALALPDLPEREFFRIGEVSDLTGIKPHVLRYWESEFPMLAPTKSNANQRLYRRNDIEMVLCLKKLLYEEGFTIAGARARLQDGRIDFSLFQSMTPSLPATHNFSTLEKETLIRLVKQLRTELQLIHAELRADLLSPTGAGQA